MSEAAPSRKQVPAKGIKKKSEAPAPVIQRPLTLRQRRYKKNRLLKMTQKDAALAAGYSENYARMACRIEKIVKPSLIEELDRAGMTDHVLARELCAMATLDPRRLYDNKGGMLPVQKWPDDVSRAISSIETAEIGYGEEAVGSTHKVKFWDKGRALELVSKLKKHLNDQPATGERDVLQIIVIRPGQEVPSSNGHVIDAQPNGNGSFEIKRAL